jgi:hypothetical protein
MYNNPNDAAIIANADVELAASLGVADNIFNAACSASLGEAESDLAAMFAAYPNHTHAEVHAANAAALGVYFPQPAADNMNIEQQ